MAVTIRAARSEDGDAVADIRVASWRATYRGTVPDSYLDTMDPNRAHWRMTAAGELDGVELLVCDVEGHTVGFACYGAARPPNFDHSGELYATYYLPDAMGKGYGTRMMAHVTDGLRRMGHGDMIVWVMEANARGRHFYENRMGATLIAGSRQSFEIEGSTIWEVAYSLRPLPEPAATR